MEKVLMVMGELYICLRPAPLPTIIQVRFLDCWFFIFMVTIEVDIGLRPENFLHITTVEYTLSTQDSLNNIHQGVWKDKNHIKIILSIIIQEYHHTLIQACHHTLIQIYQHTLIQ